MRFWGHYQHSKVAIVQVHKNYGNYVRPQGAECILRSHDPIVFGKIGHIKPHFIKHIMLRVAPKLVVQLKIDWNL